MGRNYKNYYKEENKENVVDTPIVPEENKEDVVDTPIVPEENEVVTNEDEVVTNEESSITSDTPVMPEENKDETISEEVVAKGIVSNCSRLNVREEGSMKSTVLKVIDAGTEVDILEIPSKGQFYKIKIEDIIGFCVKDFIELK